MDKVGEGGANGESNLEVYKTMCKADNQRDFSVWLRELKGAVRQVGWGGRWEAGDVGVPGADSCWCMTGNHKIL